MGKVRKKKKIFNPYGVIINAIRLTWVRDPNRRNALRRARVMVDVRNKDGSIRKKQACVGMKCESCGKHFPSTKDMEVHHIEPVGNVVELTLAKVIEKMFCTEEKLMVLCKDCHLKIHGFTTEAKGCKGGKKGSKKGGKKGD